MASASDRHLPALDGLRGLAILSVMSMHFLYSERAASTGGRFIIALAGMGGFGVDLFFVLSGFLITRILLREKGSPGYFKNFYVRRALRIFPIYYATLFAVFVVAPHFLSMDDPAVRQIHDSQGWFWTYTMNIAIARQHHQFDHGWLTIGHFWSLSVEEQFYLFWPLVVFLTNERTLWRIAIGIIVATPLLRAAAVLAGTDVSTVWTLTPFRLDELSIGAAIALLARRPEGLAPALRPAKWAAAAGAGWLLVIFLSRHLSPTVSRWLLQVAGLTMAAGGFGGLLVLTLNQSPLLDRVFRNRALGWFGKYSYAAYVIHQTILPMYRRIVTPAQIARVTGSDVVGLLGAAALYALATMGFALLSWNLFEKHFLTLKGRFEYRPAKAAPEPAHAGAAGAAHASVAGPAHAGVAGIVAEGDPG